MKKILAIAAAAALTAGVSAYAANPFSDVSPDDWAYQAVSDLSDQGVVEGYPDGTFKGERNMTRYELAQVIARLMAREDQLNAEQKATLDKLAGEYADELANLGVRVSNLEKKVGNISWSGDARMRYQDKSNDTDNWDGRMRIVAKAAVNDSTYAQARFVSEMNFKDSKDANTYADQLFVNHGFGDFAVRLGRQPVTFGNQGGWLYGSAKGYDGAQLSYKGDRFGATVGYGQFNASDYGTDITEADMFFAKANTELGPVALDLNYIKPTGEDNGELFGAGVAFNINDFRVFGEYWKNTEADDYDTAWNAGIGYGKLDLKKPGSFALSLAYNDVDAGVYFGGTGLQTDVLSQLTNKATYGDADNVTFWNAMADVTLQKNVYLHAEYAFDVDTKESETDAKDAWNVSLNYKF
ncbi:hypothetical protein GCWU000321_00849 [Dialister invisus DSM 15470]|jgi:hypothetical protein|uniref:SLH domain-containing protein n=1 Tax=Dialister invisus DSM 15470 TaxID=592028 RepID=C9LMU4_9FIRM|nr:S-layer homology domain-containing protein [Dialister invisus]EEW96880.1 hypothetical protein GCWU000321_00849 [Dialister invisus DSM 15470]